MPNDSNQHRKQGKKRKHNGYTAGPDTSISRIPRGQPSILVSCDPSRELKCKREFLEILRHDWEVSISSKTQNDKLTLDQELAQLQQPPDGPFTAFETGCKGAIIIVCTQCKPIVSLPPRNYEKLEKGVDADATKRAKVDGEAKPTTAEVTNHVIDDDASPVKAGKGTGVSDIHWDPIAAVHRITAEMVKAKSTYPDSRFCTKITPLQSLVYADMDKIEHIVTQLLIQQDRIDQPATFAIRIHRRLGGQTTSRDEIIAKIGNVVAKMAPQWTVDLKDPNITVWIEIVKTLAGISLLASPIQNLTALREQRSKASTQDSAS